MKLVGANRKYRKKQRNNVISISQHISSKTQPNLKNYGSFVNSFEFVSDLDQLGPCSFIHLEMAALRSLFVQIGGLKRMALKVWRQITPE